MRGLRVDGVRTDEMPLTQTDFHHAEPIYEELPGWAEDITGVRAFSDLPQAAQDYVTRIEELARTPVSAIGVGPGARPPSCATRCWADSAGWADWADSADWADRADWTGSTELGGFGRRAAELSAS